MSRGVDDETKKKDLTLVGELLQDSPDAFKFEEWKEEAAATALEEPAGEIAPETLEPVLPAPELTLPLPEIAAPPEPPEADLPPPLPDLPTVVSAAEPVGTPTEIKFEPEIPVSDEILVARPVTLTITGRLSPLDQEKLCALLKKENFGIEEADLKEQFESGRIILPRIGEFAAMLVVQLLRTSAAKLDLFPSDQENQSLGSNQSLRSSFESESTLQAMPFELIPISAKSGHSRLSTDTVIGQIMVSATVHTALANPLENQEIREILARLKRELQYRAFRKGANQIVEFFVQFSQSRIPLQQEMILSGLAVRREISHSLPNAE